MARLNFLWANNSEEISDSRKTEKEKNEEMIKMFLKKKQEESEQKEIEWEKDINNFVNNNIDKVEWIVFWANSWITLNKPSWILNKNNKYLTDEEQLKAFDKEIVDIYEDMTIKILLESKVNFNEFCENRKAKELISEDINIYYDLIKYHWLVNNIKDSQKRKQLQEKYPWWIIY